MWEAIRRLTPHPWTINRLIETSRQRRPTVSAYVAGLLAAGILEREQGGRTPDGKRAPDLYRLAVDRGVDPPRVRPDGSEPPASKRDRMWRSMRILKTFGAADLAAATTLPASPISEATARDYAEALCRAGYLRRHEGPRAVWTFVAARYSGPKAPEVRRGRTVWDPNRRAVVWSRDAAGGGNG